jgi:dTDP-4-dehydrorhamnose 3,5-epimerase
VWIPPGFLHGFVTLEPECEVIYKTTGYYDRASERGVVWNDPTLALPWPVAAHEVVLSEKDVVLPNWVEMPQWFSV